MVGPALFVWAALLGNDCIEKLKLPDAFAYAPSYGWISVKIAIGPDGKPSPSFFGGLPDHEPDIKDAIRESKFKTSCSGKTVQLFFEYVYQGEKSDRPKVTYEFFPPNRYRLVLAPLTPQIFKTP